MQTAGPYLLQRQLSRCMVGDVWSGADADGHLVTVAVLNELAAADHRWRDAFAAAAGALAQAGADQLPIVGSDHSAARPWVACADERGAGAAQLFTALGQRMEPVGGEPDDATQVVPTELIPAQPQTEPLHPAQPQLAAQPQHPGQPQLAAQPQHPRQPQHPGQPRHPAQLETAEPVSAQPATGRPVSAEPTGWPVSAEPTGWVAAPSSAAPSSAAPSSAAPSSAAPSSAAPEQGSEDAGTEVIHMPSAAAPHPARPATPYDVGRPQPGPYAPGRDPADSSGSFMATRPTSVQPVSGGLGPDPYPGFEPSNFPSSGFPSSGFPYAEPSSGAGDPFGYGRSRVFGSPPPKKRRTGLLIALVAVIGLLVGAGAGAGITAAVVGGRSPAPSPTGSRAAPPTREQLLLPAAAPVAPGVEPPRGGGWPSSWPTFTSTEPTRPMTGLAGVGFDFRVPPTWTCTEQQQAGAAVRYACGAGAGADRTGGDLVVRDCTAPCDEAGRTALRQKEEAWGLHWTRSGPFVTWAETTRADGKQQYGLVYVAFWRSAPEHQLDRELVLRLTSPLGRSDDLKKVVNSVRDSTFTL